MILHIATRWIRFFLLATAVAVPSAALAAEGEALGDLSSRFQFNYYAGDARALQRDLQTLKQLAVTADDVILRQYYLAYGHMRLADVLAANDPSAANRAASRCVSLSEDVLDKEPKRTPRERVKLDTLYAELWAIQAACGSFEADSKKLPGTGSSSNKARRNAAKLAPNDARVRLLAAIHESKLAEETQEFGNANQLLIAVTQLFASAPPDALDLPDWGQADAWAWLGHSYLKLGNKVAARNAIEQALVLAPDYVWAKGLQAQLKSAR